MAQDNHITHKRGDSLLLTVSLPAQIPDGQFAGWTPASQVRTDKDELVATLSVEWVNPATARTLTLACQDTSAWPVGALLLDVQFTSPAGEVRSTSTVQIYSIRDITHA